MGNVSTEWLAAISTGRDYSIDEKKKGCAVPVTPWLHPPVGKRLRDLITKLGTVRELERQEILYPQGRKVSDIVLVQQGVTARNFGNAVSGPKAAAISTPGHFACGNLNFLTRRPSLGTYFALTKAQVVICPKDLLLPVLSTDPELFCSLDAWKRGSRTRRCFRSVCRRRSVTRGRTRTCGQYGSAQAIFIRQNRQ